MTSKSEVEGKPDAADFSETTERDKAMTVLETIETENDENEVPYPSRVMGESKNTTTATTLEREEEKDDTERRSMGEARKEESEKEDSKVDNPDQSKSSQNKDGGDGSQTEEPNSQVMETIYTENMFPDPPTLPFNATGQSEDDNDPKKEPSTSLDISTDRAAPETHLQADTFGTPELLGDQKFSDSRRPSKISFSKQRQGEHSSLNRSLRSMTSTQKPIPKPKSSLKEPQYKYQREEFLDVNMLISNAKLDGLLFRLFSKPGRINAGQEEKPLPFLNNLESDIISMEPVTWNLRPMNAVQKEVLDTETEFLEETLIPKQVVRRLFMDGVLTHMDYNQITCTEGQGDKAVVRLLVATLKRRGEKAFPQFLKALKDLDYSRIWERLDSAEHSLNQGILDDRRMSERRSELEQRTASNLKTYHADDGNSEEILRQFLQSRFDNDEATNKTKEKTNPHPPETDGTQYSSNPNTNTLQSRQLEQQLDDINTELKALHENLNLLQSARSSSNVRRSLQGDNTANTTTTTTPNKSADLLSSNDLKEQKSSAQKVISTSDSQANEPTMANSARQMNSNVNKDTKQKSGTCTVM